MPALCLMLSGTYYAKNYAGIIGRGLGKGNVTVFSVRILLSVSSCPMILFNSWNSLLVKHVPLWVTTTSGKPNPAKLALKCSIVAWAVAEFMISISIHLECALIAIRNIFPWRVLHNLSECVVMGVLASPTDALVPLGKMGG